MHLVQIEASPDLVDQVFRALLDAISDGSLAPGTRITQEEVAAQLAVSRQPVLQALRLLKKDGFLLEMSSAGSAGARSRGLLVAPLDAQALAQIYQVRSTLDALAARLAAAQRCRLDPALLVLGRKAARGKNIRAMIDADLAFHNAIYSASGNPLIAQSAQLHWRHIRRAMGAVLQASSLREAVWDEHEAIAAAIADGNAPLAGKLMQQHGERASHHLATRLAEVLQNGGTP